MHRIVLRSVGALGVLLGLAMMSGCPQSPGGGDLHVAWIINGTSDTTFTHFVVGVSAGPTYTLVPLPAPLAPETIRRFEFDDAFRASVEYVGLSTASGDVGFAVQNNGTFGFGPTDFVYYTHEKSGWDKETI